MIIIATNLMPLLVTDPGQRVVWFCLLQFLATAVYAVFSAGFTPWFYHFYPQDPAQRVAYLSYNQVFSSILSSCILLLSGGLAVAVKSSGHQDALILGMMTGTFWCSILGEDTVVYFGKIPTTAVQYSTLARAVTMLILGIVLIRHWQALTPEDETALLLNQKHKHVRGV